MNHYTEFNSKTFLIILLLICAVFLVLVIKAFSYIPDSNSNKIVSRNASVNVARKTYHEDRVQEREENIEQSASVDSEDAEPQERHTVVNSEKSDSTDMRVSEQEALENIDVPAESSVNEAGGEISSSDSQSEISPEEKVLRIFFDAGKMKKVKQYVKAIEEYQKIATVTNDTDTIAKSYEEIATVYAIVKRYGTALSYAQKAYNMSPSSSREMLLARLYYKTGDIDKATRRINNVLQRDFSSDR